MLDLKDAERQLNQRRLDVEDLYLKLKSLQGQFTNLNAAKVKTVPQIYTTRLKTPVPTKDLTQPFLIDNRVVQHSQEGVTGAAGGGGKGSQAITLQMAAPFNGDVTPWAIILTEDPSDTTHFIPKSAGMNLRLFSSTDAIMDIQVSHDNGSTFASIFPVDFVFKVDAGTHGYNVTTTFDAGAYFTNADYVQGVFMSSAFDGADLTAEVTLL